MALALTGAAARSFIEAEIQRHRGSLDRMLTRFEPQAATRAWLRDLRAIEELINAPCEFPDLDDGELFMALPLWPPNLGLRTAEGPAKAMLARAFSAEAAARISNILRQLAALNSVFPQHGVPFRLENVVAGCGYLQARRRLLVALLYVMPRVCRGADRAPSDTLLAEFLPQLEISGAPLMDLLQWRALAAIHEDFALRRVGSLLRPTRGLAFLDPGGLDPERVGLLDGEALVLPDGVELATLPEGQIFGVAELLSGLDLTLARYAEFDLAATSFGRLADMIRAWAPKFSEDYYLSLPARDLRAAIQMLTTPSEAARWWRSLVFEGEDFMAATNAFQPFVVAGDEVVATVNSLTRFFQNHRITVLNRIKRYQIRSGFIFESKVRTALEAASFELTDTCRVARAEFDVVTLRGDTIWNFQCKNALLDLTLIDSDPKRYARSNRALESRFVAALAKEKAREGLLLAKFGRTKIEHRVVSRFPVSTDHPAILTWAGFEAALAKGL